MSQRFSAAFDRCPYALTPIQLKPSNDLPSLGCANHPARQTRSPRWPHPEGDARAGAAQRHLMIDEPGHHAVGAATARPKTGWAARLQRRLLALVAQRQRLQTTAWTMKCKPLRR
jgi:hypothetical protein